MGLRKKRRKVVVHHTPTGRSSVVVAVSVPLPYRLRPFLHVSALWYFEYTRCSSILSFFILGRIKWEIQISVSTVSGREIFRIHVNPSIGNQLKLNLARALWGFRFLLWYTPCLSNFCHSSLVRGRSHFS